MSKVYFTEKIKAETLAELIDERIRFENTQKDRNVKINLLKIVPAAAVIAFVIGAVNLMPVFISGTNFTPGSEADFFVMESPDYDDIYENFVYTDDIREDSAEVNYKIIDITPDSEEVTYAVTEYDIYILPSNEENVSENGLIAWDAFDISPEGLKNSFYQEHTFPIFFTVVYDENDGDNHIKYWEINSPQEYIALLENEISPFMCDLQAKGLLLAYGDLLSESSVENYGIAWSIIR